MTKYLVALWTQAPGAGVWHEWWEAETAERAAELARLSYEPYPSADGWPVVTAPTQTNRGVE